MRSNDCYGAVLLVRNTFEYDARVLRAAACLSAMGHRTAVVAVARAGLPRTESYDGIDVVRLPSPRRPRLRASIPATESASAVGAKPPAPSRRGRAERLAKRGWRQITAATFYLRALVFVSRHQPRILHCNDHNTMWVGVAARAFGLSAAVIYDTHELWPDRNGRWESRRWLLLSEWLFVRAAHKVLTASPGYAAVMAVRYRRPAPILIRNVPTGEHPARTSPREGLVYVGGLLPNRGLSQALEATAALAGLRLTLLGPGSAATREWLRSEAQRLGIADRLELVDAVAPSEVVDALTRFAIGASLIEPTCLSYALSLPNKLFEYLAAGLPVIVTEIPVLADLVRKHGIGMVVPSGDAPAVAAAVGAMLEPAAHQRYRDAVEVARRVFTWENERIRLMEAYASAVRDG